MSETNDTLFAWAAEVWTDPRASFRIVKNGDGIALMMDTPDTISLKWSADHEDARDWLTVILRQHHMRLERDRMREVMQSQPPPAEVKTRVMRRSVPQPWPPAPSYAPPGSIDYEVQRGREEEERRRRERDEADNVFIAGALEVVTEAISSWTSDDSPSSSPDSSDDFSGGGGESGGAGASGSWDD